MEKILKTYTDSDHVWIVCTGESLNGFDLSILSGLNVIAVNKAFLYLETVDAVVSIDKDTYEECYDILKRLDPVMVATNRSSNQLSHAMVDLKPFELQITGPGGLDPRPGRVRWGFNAGYTALHFAWTQGARNIHILGMDLTHKHFYDDDEITGRSSHYIEPHLRDFMRTLEYLPNQDTKITYYGPYGFEGFIRRPLSEAHRIAKELKQEVEL